MGYYSSSLSKIVLIGSGNVGFHLAQRFFEKKIQILQLFSRTETRAKTLAQQIQTSYTTDLNNINTNADLYMLAIRDDAISKVAQQLRTILPDNPLVVHTSGSTPSKIFADYFQRYGVFYPLQSFSVTRPANFEQIPICVDAANEKDLEKLENLAQIISPKVHRISDEQRAILHVAAVFVNNFSNHLFHIGESILEKEQLPFDLLRPLINETTAKIQNHRPKDMQTGPAIRNDKATIERHLKYLKLFPEFEKIYTVMTEGIKQEGERG